MNNIPNYARQTGIYNPENQRVNVKIIGCGSTGSFIALTLSKMGIKGITCIDFDTVSEENIPNQFYRPIDVNKPKVEALKEMIKEFTSTEINTINNKIENIELDIDLNSVIILCTDNMESRKLVYERFKETPIIIIDTRLGGQGYQIYTLDLSDYDQKEYEDTLNQETKDAPCGQQAVIFCILSLASEVCNIVKKIDKKEPYPKIIKRELKNYKILTDYK